MARLSPMVLVPPVLFAGLAVLFFVGMNREDPDALPSALEGREAPAVVGAPLGDLPGFTDADLRDGQVKLVNYWASWCAPCRAEHPMLEEMKENGVTILGVNYKDKPGAALGFLAELGNPYAAVIADSSGRMGIDWGIYGVPETFVIDGQGRIVLRFAGPITRRNLEADILPAIAKARGETAQ